MKFMLNKRTTIISISITAALILLYFILRFFFLSFTIHKISNKLKNEYGLNFTLQESEFMGFRSIQLKNILITKSITDTVFYSDSIYLKIKPFQLLTGKIRFKEVHVKSIKLNMSGDILDLILHYRKEKRRKL